MRDGCSVPRARLAAAIVLTLLAACAAPAPAQTEAPPPAAPQSATDAARVVVAAITAAAEANAARPAAERLKDDALTEEYVRRAAAAAAGLPKQHAAKALLLALGVGLDDSTMTRDLPWLGTVCRQIESDQQRARRLKSLGKPTIQRRHDWAQHFAVSCTLTAWAGAWSAETAGVTKEVSDANGGSGFSFADLAADLAGIAFAQHVLDGRIALKDVAGSFAVADYMPPTKDLPEGLQWNDFVAKYGSTADDRFRAAETAIRRQIDGLPGYARAGKKPPEEVRQRE